MQHSALDQNSTHAALLCTGLGTALIFLPPGATAIVMNYYDTIQQTSVQV